MTRSFKLGISIGDDVFAASWNASHWETQLANGPAPDAIREVSAELGRRLGQTKRPRIAVAILPPLVRVRRIVLPRMSDNDRWLAVTTNAERYFIAGGQTLVCAVAAIRRGQQSSVLAAAASRELIENITNGLDAAGWRIERIVPAHTAWSASIMRTHRDTRRRARSVTVVARREVEVLELESGSLVGVRRFRQSTGATPTAPEPYTIGERGEGPSAAVVAASSAWLTRSLEIVPDSMRRARARRERRIAGVVAAVACANLAGAAVSYDLRLERQLSSISARRSEIRPRAVRAAALRDSAWRDVERLTAFAELERSAPRWSAVLSRVALGLPLDASVFSVRVDGDSLAIEGEATDASRVVAGLQRTVGVRTTRAVSPILHEGSGEQAPVERWRLGLRVDHLAAVAQR